MDSKQEDSAYIETPLNLPERESGRPEGAGRVKFTQAQIDSIPDPARLCDLQRSLGVRTASIQQWCERKINPLKCKIETSPETREKKKKIERRWFKKKDVIAWLKITQRFEEKETHVKHTITESGKAKIGRRSRKPGSGRRSSGAVRSGKGDVSQG
jgi:hypothetical protein